MVTIGIIQALLSIIDVFAHPSKSDGTLFPLPCHLYIDHWDQSSDVNMLRPWFPSTSIRLKLGINPATVLWSDVHSWWASLNTSWNSLFHHSAFRGVNKVVGMASKVYGKLNDFGNRGHQPTHEEPLLTVWQVSLTSFFNPRSYSIQHLDARRSASAPIYRYL